MSRPLVFLTDTDPGKHDVVKLCAPARAVLERPAEAPAPRNWFTAANNLALAAATTGAGRRAADLMELSVELAGRLSTSNADDIAYGIESCLNRVDLLRQEDAAAAESAYRACYDLVAGRPVSRRRLFGLNIGALNAASPEVRRWALAALLHRGQLGLLKLYLQAGGVAGAEDFAREVVADFPGPVAAGMLHPVEVLALADHEDPFLRRFDVRDPRTEGDFVVLLRTLDLRSAPAGRNVATDPGLFASAVARFRAGHALRNPRTPLLWAVRHGLALGLDPDLLRAGIEAALDACRRDDDRALYRSIATLVRDHATVPPFPTTDAADADPESLVTPLARAGAALPGVGGARSSPWPSPP